ncbi:unnamed protein product [Dovyalis caffra]|uniref:Uncharacterized protein n=1 Tax=Dovyalis caffra TaxID=77055 RepID=A0AAV1R4H5_9ROSI|nr:unnamed protein product [Dovyalis caffra]
METNKPSTSRCSFYGIVIWLLLPVGAVNDGIGTGTGTGLIIHLEAERKHRREMMNKVRELENGDNK